MSEYYSVPRTRDLYKKGQKETYKISRTKIELSLECPRCFYVDRKLGVSRPPGFPFNLNSAVDTLLKKEFDAHRSAGTQHPLQKQYGIDAIPLKHEDLDTWRHNFTGVHTIHEQTNFHVFGAVDDVWVNGKGEYIVVDYKATSKSGKIETLDQEWHKGYKRQMEIYQWLLRRKGYKVSSTGYFVYCNGNADKKAFDGRLEFEVTLIPYTGNDSWVEEALFDAKKILEKETLPNISTSCDFCTFHEVRKKVEESVSKQNTLF